MAMIRNNHFIIDSKYIIFYLQDNSKRITYASAEAVITRVENRSQSISQMVPLWPLNVPKRSPDSARQTDGT